MPRADVRARLVAALRAAVVVTAAVLASPALAMAHAELVESSPAASATLIEAPRELELRFTEPIDPDLAVVELLDATQAAVDGLGPVDVVADGRVARVTLPALDEGVYTVTYQVVSTVDGHATAGSFAFVVDPTGTQPPPAEPSATQPGVDPAAVAARWVGLLGALVALGTVVAWLRSRTLLPRAAGDMPWPLLAVAGLAAFAGTAAYLALSARPIVEALPQRAAGFPLDFAGPYGATPFANAARLALVGAALVVLAGAAGWLLGRRAGLGLPLGALAAGVAALLGMSMAAHAAATGGPLSGLVDLGHLVAVAVWLGALPALGVLGARRVGSERVGHARLLRHHGAVAVVAAPVVAVTGLANSPLVLGSARDLVASEYGNLLLAKAVLLSVALAIGAVNHFALRGRGRADVALLVAAELVVAVTAVAAAATMVTIQPAAARQPTLEAPPIAPAHLFGTAGVSSIHATIELPTPGRQRYLVTVLDTETGRPRADVQRVFLELTPPSGTQLETERVRLEPDAAVPGLYSATGAHLSVEGEWGVAVVVRRAGALDERATFEVPVRRPTEPQLVPPADTGVGVPAPLAVLWSFLPPGIVGWIPGLVAGVALIGIGFATRARRSAVLEAVRVGLAALAFLALLAAGSRSLVTAATAPGPDDLAAHRPPDGFTASVEDGRAIYLANCAACHGVDGEGDGPVRTLPDAGPLAEAVGRMSSAELSYRIANGIAGTAMPAFAAALTETERWHLVRYLEQRWNTD